MGTTKTTLGLASMSLIVLSAAIAISTPTTLIFRSGDNRQTTATGDWAPGQFKAECSASWVTGISQSSSDHSAHAALCDTRPLTPGTFLGALDFSQGDNRPSPYRSNDWDPGFFKAECSMASQGAVVGIAQTTDGKVTKIACRAGAPLGTNAGSDECAVRVFYSRNSRGNPAAADWDSGAFEGECQGAQPGDPTRAMYVRGVSRDFVSGAPHAILCCY
jgi:hypothetical protein